MLVNPIVPPCVQLKSIHAASLMIFQGCYSKLTVALAKASSYLLDLDLKERKSQSEKKHLGTTGVHPPLLPFHHLTHAAFPVLPDL